MNIFITDTNIVEKKDINDEDKLEQLSWIETQFTPIRQDIIPVYKYWSKIYER